MVKTYINNAIVGNSSMLGCFSDRGELTRLFWPNIDYQQHIDRMLFGIFSGIQRQDTMWLHDRCWRHSQSYEQDTNILKTVHISNDDSLCVVQTDFVLHGRDILIKRYEIENRGMNEIDAAFVLYSSFVTSTPDSRGTLFEFTSDALIHYKHGCYMSISADEEISQFQLGNNAYESALRNELKGYDNIGMMPDGAVSWKLGKIGPHGKKILTINICASHTMEGVKKSTYWIKEADKDREYKITGLYWRDFLKSARRIETGNKGFDGLYKRSLLVFKLMADEKTGGLLASPEIDEGFTKCGRYAYCWGRDAAFITEALDRCGLTGIVGAFYKWAVISQDDDGSWQQRYHMDGNLAPSWGLQIDETGALIWGMLKHYETVKDRDYLDRVWESVIKGVGFLLSFTDGETGLPGPSYDLWEERVGEHAYSSAAVYGGIRAGVEIGEIVGAPEDLVARWRAAASALKQSIEKNFWKEEKKRFLRSIRTKLNPWGEEHSTSKTVIRVNPKGYYRDVTLEDGTVDASLLGLTIPFDVFDVWDYRVGCTVEAIERVLASGCTGGIKRYENDNYIGGNPWIVTSLWVALYHIRKKNFDKARAYLEWAVKGRTELDLLPEQVDKGSGKPVWVIPLTWSHAMFVLVLIELVDAGELH